MRISMAMLHVLLLIHPLIPAVMAEEDSVALEVITDSSPCSTTCGLGIKTQTLCLLKDSKTAMEENDISQSEVSATCRVQKVKCVDSWQCGLTTVTVKSGQRLELDCLEEVMEAMGKFSWRVSWRYARGIISSDDSLFARWEAPHLDRVVLDPVTEEDAGTYRCDVQDTSYRRVKRAYWGVRVLPAGVVNLDYQSALTEWDVKERQPDPGVLQLTTARVLLHARKHPPLDHFRDVILFLCYGDCKRFQRRYPTVIPGTAVELVESYKFMGTGKIFIKIHPRSVVIGVLLTGLWIGLLCLYRTIHQGWRDQ